MARYLTFLAFLVSTVASGQEHAALRDKVLKEAPAAWSKYLQLACHAQGKMKSSQVDKVTGKTLYGSTIAFKTNGSMGLCIKERPDKPKRLECDNGEYSFVLDEESPTKWSLSQVAWARKKYDIVNAFDLSNPGEDTMGSKDWQQAIAVPGAGLFISAVWLPAIFDSPSFKLVNARPAEDEGIGLIRVDFEYVPQSNRNNPIRNGYVILDPSRYWLIQRSEVQASWDREDVKGVIETENKFDDTIPGFPYVAQHISIRRIPPAIFHESTHLIELKKLDASEIEPFRLPTYGIPEPVNPQPARQSSFDPG